MACPGGWREVHVWLRPRIQEKHAIETAPALLRDVAEEEALSNVRVRTRVQMSSGAEITSALLQARVRPKVKSDGTNAN